MPDPSPVDPPLLPALFEDQVPRSPAEAALRRRIAGFLRAFDNCERPGCRRARTCVGDPSYCVLLCWIAWSEYGRVWAGAAIAALADDASERVAALRADAALVAAVKRAEGLPPG